MVLLSAGAAPSHSGALEPLRDQRFTGGLDDAEHVEIAPVVVRPVGDGDHLQVGPSPEHGVELGTEHRLQRRLLRLGHAREGQCIEPLALGIVEG